MINSRKVDDLHPYVAKLCHSFIDKCKDEGIDVIITSTFRDHESQNALYAQGRTAPGSIVTKAKGGQSMHNWKVAFDFVPNRNGKLVWGTTGADLAVWERCGVIAESVGLEWGGRWKFKDMPHCQFTGGLTLADFQAGKTLGVSS